MRLPLAIVLAFAACEDGRPVSDLSVPDLGVSQDLAMADDFGTANDLGPPDLLFPDVDCGAPLTSSGVVTCNDMQCTNGCTAVQKGGADPVAYQCCGPGGCSASRAVLCDSNSQCSPLVCASSGCCASVGHSFSSGSGNWTWSLGSTCSNNCEAFYHYSTVDSENVSETTQSKLCASKADCGDPMAITRTVRMTTTGRWEVADHCCHYVGALPGFKFCMPASFAGTTIVCD